MSSTTTVKSKLLPFTVSNDPLPDKLKPLLDEQLEIYDKHMDSSQRTLFELEGKIRAFEKELEGLKMKKDDEQHRLEGLRGTKAALRSSVSAVRRLPAEIIASIIQLAVNNGASDRFGGEKAAFMVLRCVSKVWRRTAFSTPSLWKNVNLALSEFLGDHGEAKSNLFTALDTWFSRAGEGTGLTLLVLGHGPRVLGADDIVAWIQQSHFNIFHLSFYHPIDSADSLKSLCREKALSLSETTRLVVSNPQRPLFHSGSNDIPTIDVSCVPKAQGHRLGTSRRQADLLEALHSTYPPNIGQDRAGSLGLSLYRSLHHLACIPKSHPHGALQLCRCFSTPSCRAEISCSLSYPLTGGMALGKQLESASKPSRLSVAYDSDVQRNDSVTLASFIQRSNPSCVTLGLTHTYLINELNVILSLSSKITAIVATSPSVLQLDKDANGSRLKTPPLSSRLYSRKLCQRKSVRLGWSG